MKSIYLQCKLSFTVPDYVINSLWNIHNKYNTSYGNHTVTTNGHKNSIVISEFMVPRDKKLLENKDSVHFVEHHKLRTEWLFIDDDIIVVDKFIKQHFSSAFQFRIDRLLARQMQGWHANHPYPRVFIPMHENICRFKIKANTESFDNLYNLGECWMWDVRQLHMVDNTKSDQDRVMALFDIDPAIETNTEIFN